MLRWVVLLLASVPLVMVGHGLADLGGIQLGPLG